MGVAELATELVAAAIRFAAVEGLPPPCAVQLPYSLAYTQFVEDDAMLAALDPVGARVVASAVLAGGALSGKYSAGAVEGGCPARSTSRGDDGARDGFASAELPDEWGTIPCQLAIAFALVNPRVSSVLSAP